MTQTCHLKCHSNVKCVSLWNSIIFGHYIKPIKVRTLHCNTCIKYSNTVGLSLFYSFYIVVAILRCLLLTLFFTSLWIQPLYSIAYSNPSFMKFIFAFIDPVFSFPFQMLSCALFSYRSSSSISPINLPNRRVYQRLCHVFMFSKDFKQ